jgi:iron(III) transport system substrate-binding protein
VSRGGVAVTAFAVLVALVAFAGCGGPGGRSIVLYDGQHPQLTTALVAAFEKQTGIAVEMRTNDSVVLADQILQEGGASPADVYISENSPELMTLEEHGLLGKLTPAILDQVPAADASPVGEWVGMALRVSSLVYNPARLPASQLPSSVLDLARPSWKGRIALAPTDSDFPPVVGAVAATYGAKTAAGWLAGLKRNAQTYQDEEAVVAAVNRGDVAAGIVNQYYWYRLRLEVGANAVHSALYFFPGHDPGSITNISGAATLASSKHRADAERFIAFLVGKTGQRIIARSDDFEYPARPGIAPNSALPRLAAVAHDTLRAASLGDDQLAARLIQQAGLI